MVVITQPNPQKYRNVSIPSPCFFLQPKSQMPKPCSSSSPVRLRLTCCSQDAPLCKTYPLDTEMSLGSSHCNCGCSCLPHHTQWSGSEKNCDITGERTLSGQPLPSFEVPEVKPDFGFCYRPSLNFSLLLSNTLTHVFCGWIFGFIIFYPFFLLQNNIDYFDNFNW